MFKKIIILLVLSGLLSGLLACTENKNNAKESSTNTKSGLKISYLDFKLNVKTASEMFKKKYEDVSLEEDTFSSDKYDEFRKKLATQVMTGEGPDIIIFDEKTFGSLNKTLSSGVFADMNELIKNDKEFKMSDYNEKIMNYGVVDGKRLFIPLSYDFNCFCSTKKILADMGIKYDEANWTWNVLGEYIKNYIAENKGKDRYFFDENFGFKTMVQNSGISFVDYKNKKTNFNSKEFIELMKIYKDIYPAIATDRASIKYSGVFGMLSKNAVAMIAEAGLGSPAQLRGTSSAFQAKVGDEMEILPIPTLNSGKYVYTRVYDLVAINAKCKDKTAALNFIKILISKIPQENQITYQIYGAPININAYKEDVQFYLQSINAAGDYNYSETSTDDKGKAITVASGTYPVRPLSEGVVSNMNSLLDIAQEPEIQDSQIYKMINEEMKEYIEDKRTVEQTAKRIDEKVSLYLNE
jgi:multiple sugar transport system substrate-binding protein